MVPASWDRRSCSMGRTGIGWTWEIPPTSIGEFHAGSLGEAVQLDSGHLRHSRRGWFRLRRRSLYYRLWPRGLHLRAGERWAHDSQPDRHRWPFFNPAGHGHRLASSGGDKIRVQCGVLCGWCAASDAALTIIPSLYVRRRDLRVQCRDCDWLAWRRAWRDLLWDDR